MIDTQRVSLDGKAAYTSTVTCDACKTTIAEGSEAPRGAFLEHENAAYASSRLAAANAAHAAGGVAQGDEDGFLCAKCAPANPLTSGERAMLAWFRAANGPVAPGIRYGRRDLAAMVEAGYLRAVDLRTWQITDAGAEVLDRNAGDAP